MAPVSAGSPYERALHDRAFLERFARAYRGDAEPLDALWWHEHPDDPSPSGTPASAALPPTSIDHGLCVASV